MPRLKTFLTLLITIFFLFMLCGCGLFRQQHGAAEPYTDNMELPEWLKLSYRQSGPMNFEFEPLNLEDHGIASGEDEESSGDQPAASTGSGSYRPPNPTGSPYAPGTLDDMIWQQKQRDKQ